MENTSTILSPVMVWRDFNSDLPLKESVTSDETFDNVIYSDIYFSGRQTADGSRVRNFTHSLKICRKKAEKREYLLYRTQIKRWTSNLLTFTLSRGMPFL